MNPDLIGQFREGIKKFNSKQFYECHDIWEDVWFDSAGADKDFVQGLIHIAVGLHHIVDKNNPRGALLQFNKAALKLKPFMPLHEEINTKALLRSIDDCVKEVKKIQSGRKKSFNVKLVPKL